MTRNHAEAIRQLYPWVSVERASDMLEEAADVLGAFSSPAARARFVLAKLLVLWGPPGEPVA